MSGPPPPPPGPPPPPKVSAPPVTKDRKALLGDIHKGKKLKKTVTNDRSGPDLTVAKKGSSGSGGGPMGMPMMGGGPPRPGPTPSRPGPTSTGGPPRPGMGAAPSRPQSAVMSPVKPSPPPSISVPQSSIAPSRPGGTTVSPPSPRGPVKSTGPPISRPGGPAVGGGGGAKAKALYEFAAQRSGDLSFKKGDIINLTKEDGNGWWEGECNGQQGQFPSNYVEKIQGAPPPPAAAPPARPRPVSSSSISPPAAPAPVRPPVATTPTIRAPPAPVPVAAPPRPPTAPVAPKMGGAPPPPPMGGGPPPPPPPMGGAPPPPPPVSMPAASKDRKGLLSDIQKGKKLKKAVTNDRSAPIVKEDKSAKGGGSGMGIPMMGGGMPKPAAKVGGMPAPKAVVPAVKPSPVTAAPSFRGPPAPKVVTPPSAPSPARVTPPSNGGSFGAPKAAAPPIARPGTKQAIALYSFPAQQSGDLSFSQGDVITVLKQDGAWWQGSCNGKTGAFPSNYVQLQ